MKRLAQTRQKPDQDQPTRLIHVIDAVVPGASAHIMAMPEIPHMLWDRWDLAWVFNRHYDTIHTWEQKGWITCIRRPSGRVEGYPAEQVVAIAARLFKSSPKSTFVKHEAEIRHLVPLLTWVERAVRDTVTMHDAGKEALLDVLALAALAESADGIMSTQSITDEDLVEHKEAAIAQLRARIRDPYARHLLLRAWRQAGAVLRTQSFKSTKTNP